jgi:hypothetical protein
MHDTYRLLRGVPAGSVVLCELRHHHLCVALGTQRATLEQRLAVVHTPAAMPRPRTFTSIATLQVFIGSLAAITSNSSSST